MYVNFTRKRWLRCAWLRKENGERPRQRPAGNAALRRSASCPRWRQAVPAEYRRHRLRICQAKKVRRDSSLRRSRLSGANVARTGRRGRKERGTGLRRDVPARAEKDLGQVDRLRVDSLRERKKPRRAEPPALVKPSPRGRKRIVARGLLRVLARAGTSAAVATAETVRRGPGRVDPGARAREGPEPAGQAEAVRSEPNQRAPGLTASPRGTAPKEATGLGSTSRGSTSAARLRAGLIGPGRVHPGQTLRGPGDSSQHRVQASSDQETRGIHGVHGQRGPSGAAAQGREDSGERDNDRPGRHGLRVGKMRSGPIPRGRLAGRPDLRVARLRVRGRQVQRVVLIAEHFRQREGQVRGRPGRPDGSRSPASTARENPLREQGRARRRRMERGIQRAGRRRVPVGSGLAGNLRAESGSSVRASAGPGYSPIKGLVGARSLSRQTQPQLIA